MNIEQVLPAGKPAPIVGTPTKEEELVLLKQVVLEAFGCEVIFKDGKVNIVLKNPNAPLAQKPAPTAQALQMQQMRATVAAEKYAKLSAAVRNAMGYNVKFDGNEVVFVPVKDGPVAPAKILTEEFEDARNKSCSVVDVVPAIESYDPSIVSQLPDAEKARQDEEKAAEVEGVASKDGDGED